MEISRNSHYFATSEREMVRFAVGGDEDGNEDRPTTRPLPKRPRVNPILPKRPIAAAASNPRDRPTTSAAAAPPPEIERITPPEERVSAGEESTDESETSWSDSLSDSSSEESGEEEEDVQQPQPTPPSGGVVQPAEARADPTASGSDAGREAEGPSGSVSVTLADPDVLDCPICFEPLCSPVYQVLFFHNQLRNLIQNCNAIF